MNNHRIYDWSDWSEFINDDPDDDFDISEFDPTEYYQELDFDDDD